MRISRYTLLFASALVFNACGTEEDPVDTSVDGVEFTVDAPASEGTYAFGETVRMEGSIYNEAGLHGLALELVNTSNDSTVFYSEEHAHGTEVNYSETWVNNMTEQVTMQLTITAAITHDNDLETEVITFTCLPN